MPLARWILFDVGGVLEQVDDDAWPERWFERTATRTGLTVEEARARVGASDLPDVERESGVEPAYWARLAEALGADEATREAIRADFWDAYCGTADEALLDEVRALRGRVGLAILSNSCDGAREQEARRFGFPDLFDPICYSHELGLKKPDPAIYAAALTAMGADAGEVLFIDDHEENIAAARDAGLTAHRHVGLDGTLAAIRAATGLGGRSDRGPTLAP